MDAAVYREREGARLRALSGGPRWAFQQAAQTGDVPRIAHDPPTLRVGRRRGVPAQAVAAAKGAGEAGEHGLVEVALLQPAGHREHDVARAQAIADANGPRCGIPRVGLRERARVSEADEYE